MAERFYLDKSDVQSWKALNGLALKVQAATTAAGLSRRLVELVNVRVSQINGCAFCLDLHFHRAVEAGETTQRLSVLNDWRDTDLFSDLEAAALTVAEAVTELPSEAVRTRELAAAREVLTDEQYSAVSWAVIAMNAFNRVSIVSRHKIVPRP